ncbi:MAG: septation protein SpoVG family protein [Elusimicrobiota bacterium]|nr:septation protein SpoVG family protein [Elusimicrobiota bacterium]
MAKKIFVVLTLLLSININVWAALNITNIKKTEQGYTLTFNDQIKISNITIKDKLLIFAVSNSDKSNYAPIQLLKREVNKNLTAKVLGGHTTFRQRSLTFEVAQIKKVDNAKNTIAFCKVIFDDVLEVECRVLHGKKGLWVAWPALKQSNKWRNNFVFTDKALKKNVEASILKALDVKE